MAVLTDVDRTAPTLATVEVDIHAPRQPRKESGPKRPHATKPAAAR